MKSKAVKFGIIAGVLPHIFCCGLPIALSVVGLVAPEMAHTHIIPAWMEPWIFVIGACALAFSWIMIARDCGCACDSCHGARTHRRQKIILGLITALFVISILLHIMV